MANSFVDAQRKIRSALIASRLRLAPDSIARDLISECDKELDRSDLQSLAVTQEAWKRVTGLGIEPKLVFCHPDVIVWDSRTSVYYRGISTLSLKAIRDYAGSVNILERMDKSRKVTADKALKMAKAYNQFTSVTIEGTDDWTTEDADRQIIATLGITLDGVMRNRIGQEAEKRVREMMLEWLIDQGLLVVPALTPDQVADTACRRFKLAGGVDMIFSSEPDVSFKREADGLLLCTVEIKGGTDPAGALERYGAGKKSLEAALRENPKCKNFFLSAVFTPEMTNRIDADRLIEKSYSIVDLIEDQSVRDEFFSELFVYTLRLREL